MLDSAIIDSLAAIVGQENVLSDPYNLDIYSADALTPFRAFGEEHLFKRLADVVVRPASAAQI